MNPISYQDIIAAIYPIPDPPKSAEDWWRSTQQDLLNMTEAELRREYARVNWVLLFGENPHHWLVERKERLKALLQNGKRDE